MASFPKKALWTKKPNNPEWDFSNPIVANATSLLSLTNNGLLPYDEAEKASWTADTTNGTTPYKYQPIDGSIQFARQDLDYDGITYSSQTNSIDTNSNPFFICMAYTVLIEPNTSASRGIFAYDTAPRLGSPVVFLGAQSTTLLRYYANGGYRFTDIPVQVGKKHLLIHRFDGSNTHDFYDSAKGVWETYTGGSTNGSASNSFWMGSGYLSEMPVAFEMFVSSIGYTPSLKECKELAKNPYSLFQKRTQYISLAATASAALTGTMTASVTESDIVSGGKTIIITLTGDTFVAAGTGPIGSTADTQALIDGFDAATSPANGWNNEVRDKALTSEVVRTSSTVATWTVSAQAGYDVTAQETITGTIPAAVLTLAAEVTAAPTFTVDETASGRILGSLAYRGGLAGHGGIAGIGGGLAG